LAGLASPIALSRRPLLNMHLWKMPKKASGRNQKCRQHVVEMFPANEGRENGWAQIGISACVLLLPPVLAIAVLVPRSFRPESGETPAVFEVAESSSTSLPVTDVLGGRAAFPSCRASVPLNLTTDFPKKHQSHPRHLGALRKRCLRRHRARTLWPKAEPSPRFRRHHRNRRHDWT